MKNMEITLNVYNEDMETVKEVHTAKLVKIPFGLVRKLMGLCRFSRVGEGNP